MTDFDFMDTAIQLKEQGWVAQLTPWASVSHLRAKSNWCRETYGPMYVPNEVGKLGRWFVASLESRRQVVFLFRDEKLYSMFKIMWAS